MFAAGEYQLLIEEGNNAQRTGFAVKAGLAAVNNGDFAALALDGSVRRGVDITAIMCAECHSTGVRKNYDAASDRFATSWAEISVGCEACHGKGSAHVAWAQDRQSFWSFARREDPDNGLIVRFEERHDVTWPIDPKNGNARRSIAPATLRKEVETCGLCHARRASFSEDWAPGRWLSHTHRVSPLIRGLYHADGQMRDEVYNYGSFKQSKMFAAGVTCSDCHEPHSGKPRLSGDGVCLQCHASQKYASATHHHHATATPPLSCASCHMPAQTYMRVDPRHDHSFRVPRPDLTVKFDLPNACNACHTDKSAWAASTIEGWHGSTRKGLQNYAEAFHAAWANQANAGGASGRGRIRPRSTGFRARQFARRSGPLPLARHRRGGAEGFGGSRPHGADRCPRHPRCRARRTAVAARRAAAVRCRWRRADPGRLAARRRSKRASRRPTASASPARRPNSWPPSASTTIVRKRA